jgi:hypothetical protein
MLIINVAYRQIDASNLDWQPNNNKYDEKHERKVCHLNPIPHG